MAIANRLSPPDPFIYIPKDGKPQLLFVLLHGEAASPEQLFPLAEALKAAFPLAVVVLPYAYEKISPDHADAQVGKGIAGYHWVDPVALGPDNHAARVAQSLPRLIEQVRELQARYGLGGQQTALAGFSEGASMALEASHAQPELAGRVLAFCGLYVTQPTSAPPATLLHFFHGANDQQVSIQQVETTLARLAELQGDATLDVASRIGHELHAALIKQAIVRLQTCVPLRSWEDAMNALEAQARAELQAQTTSSKTLH